MINQNDWWEHKRNCALHHSGIKGMKWGVRRYQNKDGTLTAAGKKHYAGDGNAGEGATAKTEYAPKRKGGKAEDYSDEELRARKSSTATCRGTPTSARTTRTGN